MNFRFITLAFLFISLGLLAQKTQRVYLSGTGADNTKEWDFFCTEGMNSGKWSKIAVPSCWEQQGFGQYQYGMKFYGKAFPDGVAGEKGLYKTTFQVPSEWRGKQVILVFEASMTDTEVKINGQKAGPIHQGAFYRFSYNITERVKYGKENLLEVAVSKESENAGVNLAERRADYWNFGGIFRPVFLEIHPSTYIQQISIDAQANGIFNAQYRLNRAISSNQNTTESKTKQLESNLKIHTRILDEKGTKVAEIKSIIQEGSDFLKINLTTPNPKLWTAENPHLHSAEISLVDSNGKTIHQRTEKFGFRTIEVKKSDGLYINGTKVNIRGVNRHSFRPETGRTLSWKMNLEDVQLIKSMNMNSVRLSHYPADPEFLDICDSLGLYVMNELGGWHGHYETIVGENLIKGLVERDLNHPSVIWWSNGNEGGWNNELNDEFHKYDIQKRPVLHPQGNFGGFETMHYRSYGESQEYMRKPEIFMPTEFLHGLYDGGHGAGLKDYWDMMYNHPRCAGGFLWVLADEGLKRLDQNGFIDNVGNYGADGIVGPHHEKEGSYYTVKEIWSPVQIHTKKIGVDFTGLFEVENRYDFTNLSTCSFEWQEVRFLSSENDKTEILRSGKIQGPDIKPRTKGQLQLNTSSLLQSTNAFYLTAKDASGQVLWKWSYPVKREAPLLHTMHSKLSYSESDSNLIVQNGDRKYNFSKETGYLISVDAVENKIQFGAGPRFVAARRADRSLDQFYNHDDDEAQKKNRTYTLFEDKGKFTGFKIEEIELKQSSSNIQNTNQDKDEPNQSSNRNQNANQQDKNQGNRMLQLTVNYGLGNLDKVCWKFFMDGTVEMSYQYNFNGVVDLMGIMFDYPEEKVISKKWLGNGPYRVWQNRLEGTEYNLWENNYNDPVPGESFTYPEFKGYFGGVSWMKLNTKEGKISLYNKNTNKYVGIYAPRDGRDRLLYTLPATGISVLDVIPPVRNKVNATDLIGPSSQAVWAKGNYAGTITLFFD